MSHATALLAGIGALMLVGCIDSIEPELGLLSSGQCSNEDSNPDVEVSFSRDIVEGILTHPEIDCARCHTAEGATPVGLQASGFDAGSYQSFRAGGFRSGSDIVIPGAPCDSIVIQKVAGTAGFGSRMPLNGPPFLSAEELTLFSDWVAEGALDN